MYAYMCTNFLTFLDYTDILLDLYILQLYTIIHLFVLTLILRINFKFKDLSPITFYRLAIVLLGHQFVLMNFIRQQ